ncbi:MAG: hypothetical protein Q8M24_08715 [Pseudolabrys sp.]|nr:hypothetical protein [Pseudolabrys sp.]MDP2295528.1 hypothetical protein [Pseudolabrys sp.]
MHLYSVSGLAVASELALPGLTALTADRAPPDVVIRSGAVPESLTAPGASGPTWQIAGPQFLLRIPDVARFLLIDGREIVHESEPGGDPADIPVFLLGTAFGILLHQRGQIVLHASAVRVGDKAILFCGPSGAGKSTLAAALLKRGCPLVTDDVCAISIAANGVPMVHPDGRQLKLWAQAIGRLDLAASRGERVRTRLEKFYVEPDRAHAGALPLGAVYGLREARPPWSAGIASPNTVDAALLLRRNAYRPQLVERMDQKAGYFHAATTIANAAGIFHLTRRLDFADMPLVIGWLERHWQDIGLLEKAA